MVRLHLRFLFACLFPLVAAIVLTASPAAAEAPMANIDVMRQLSSDALDDIVSRMAGAINGRSLAARPRGNDERYRFLETEVSKALTGAGYRTVIDAAPARTDTSANNPSSPLEFEYEIVDFSLTYPEIYRSYLIGGKKVKRAARIDLVARLVDPYDGSVLWVGESTQVHDDQFEHRYLDQVEAGLFEFTKPERSGTSWGKVVEPVVVSGIIVGLIYLFFSNQNDS